MVHAVDRSVWVLPPPHPLPKEDFWNMTSRIRTEGYIPPPPCFYTYECGQIKEETDKSFHKSFYTGWDSGTPNIHNRLWTWCKQSKYTSELLQTIETLCNLHVSFHKVEMYLSYWTSFHNSSFNPYVYRKKAFNKLLYLNPTRAIWFSCYGSEWDFALQVPQRTTARSPGINRGPHYHDVSALVCLLSNRDCVSLRYSSYELRVMSPIYILCTV